MNHGGGQRNAIIMKQGEVINVEVMKCQFFKNQMTTNTDMNGRLSHLVQLHFSYIN